MARLKLLTTLMLTLIVIGVGALSSYLGTQLHQVMPTDEVAPDAYAEGIDGRQFDQQGKVTRRFQAKHVVFFDGIARANAREPHLSMQLSNGNPVNIRAHLASLKDKKTVHLQGGVNIQTRTTSHSAPITLQTETMDYAINDEYASTSDPVTIASPALFRLTAIGMNADFKSEQYTLKQRVRGIYEPTMR